MSIFKLGKKVYYIAIPKIICFMGFYVTTYFYIHEVNPYNFFIPNVHIFLVVHDILYGTIDKWVNNVLFVHGTSSVPLVEFLLFFKYRYNIFHVLDSLELTVKRKTFKTI